MALQSLIICSDDKILRVLRRVLNDLEIGVEQSMDAESAVRRLTRQRFEAVIVDCDDEAVAASVLKSVRSAPCNKHAVAVAVIDSTKAVKSAFALGAHFVLYKPISVERAKSSFRAARALMKCERRRNTRVAIELPVTLSFGNAQQKTTLSDLSEGGMAIRFKRQAQNTGQLRVSFILPGQDAPIETAAEFAWSSDSAQAGIRFVNLTIEQQTRLKAWLAKHSPEIEEADPPAPCKLTDLSLGGCYLELPAPFPVRTIVTLAARIGDQRVEVTGVVRVMHHETGMGLEFTRTSDSQRLQVEKFIQSVVNAKGTPPTMEVQPEGTEDLAQIPVPAANAPAEDPLLDLFRNRSQIPREAFLGELRRQRAPQAAAAHASG
jgi:c-di-GMP-binding flagellar brake protein YcgR